MITAFSSFYIAGGTLPGDAPSYVRRQADDDLLAGLLQGEFSYVLTSRQMGKSSLMVRTAARLREQGVAVAVIELTVIGQNVSVEQWYDGLLGRIGRALKLSAELEEYWLEHERLSPLLRWMRALREVVLERYPGPLVVFVDEIDLVRSLPFSTDEFFAAIRECNNLRAQDPEYRRLTFCLLGVAAPSDLIRDPRMTPFNIGRRVELTDFALPEVVGLAAGLPCGPHRGRALLERVLYWTGGHPYLTQRLCQALAENAAAESAADVDRICEAVFLGQKARHIEANLTFVSTVLLRSHPDVAGVLDLYRQVRAGKKVADDPGNPQIAFLRLSGIARVAGGLLRVRNRIYERAFDGAWVAANMPDAERRRQRAALWRGRMQVAGVAFAFLGLALYAGDRAWEARRLLGLADVNLLKGIYAVGLNRLQERDMPAARVLFARAATQADPARAAEARERLLETQINGARIAAARQMPRGRRAFDFRADGQHLVVSTGGEIRLWSLEAGAPERTLATEVDDPTTEEDDPAAVAVSPDERWVAFPTRQERAGEAGEKHYAYTVNLWSVAGTSGPAVRRTLHLPNEAVVDALAFSPDAKWLFSGCGDGAGFLWDLEKGDAGAAVKIDLPGGFASAAFSPDGAWLAAGGWSGTIRLWQIQALREAKPDKKPEPDAVLEKHGGRVGAVAFSADGTRLLSASQDRTVAVWHLQKRQKILLLPVPASWPRSVTFLPGARSILAACDDGAIRRWETDTAVEGRALYGHAGSVRGVAVAEEDRAVLASCSDDQTVRLWDLRTFGQIDAFKHDSGVCSVALSHDGRWLVSGDSDGTLHIDDLKPGRLAAPRSKKLAGAHEKQIWGVAVSPDERRVASAGNDKKIRVWDLATGELVRVISEHTREIYQVVFSPDGRRLASAGEDRTVRVWDAETGKQIQSFKNATGALWVVAYSRDGGRLLTGGDDDHIQVWDLGENRMVYRQHHGGQVTCVAAARVADRQIIASTGSDGTVRLWDLETGIPLYTLRGHIGPVQPTIFTGDGRWLATGGDDGVVRLWDMAAQGLFNRESPEALLAAAQRETGSYVKDMEVIFRP